MTFEETKKILDIIKITYPQSFAKHDAESASLLIKLWFQAFQYVPYQIVSQAVRTVIFDTDREFAPPPGVVMAQVKRDITELDAEKQWELLTWIVRNATEMLHLAAEKYGMDEIGKRIANESYIRRLKTTDSKGIEIEHNNFIKRYNSEKENYEREALQTGNLLLITTEEKLLQLGAKPNELMIEHKES